MRNRVLEQKLIGVVLLDALFVGGAARITRACDEDDDMTSVQVGCRNIASSEVKGAEDATS